MENPTLTLYPNKTKTLLSLLVSILFVIIGIGMISGGKNTGWFVSIFFSLCTIIFIVILLPNSYYLHISNQGFEICSMYRKSFTKWDEVEQFGFKYIGVKKMVVFNYSQDHSKFQTGKNMARTLTGAEGALPDTYGKSAEELVKLLNEWKEIN